MTKKLLLIIVKGFNVLTSVRFLLGFLTGCGAIMVVLGTAVGYF